MGCRDRWPAGRARRRSKGCRSSPRPRTAARPVQAAQRGDRPDSPSRYIGKSGILEAIIRRLEGLGDAHMKLRDISAIVALGAFALAPAALAKPPAKASGYAAPRTAFGQPDLQGNW